MILGTIILFGVTLAGVFGAAKVLGDELSKERKIGTAAVFAILNIVPIDFPGATLTLSMMVLFFGINNRDHSRADVWKMYGLTLLFAIIGILIIYLPQLP